MALAFPRAGAAAPRSPAGPATIAIGAAPGYRTQERASNLSTPDGWAVALVHSSYTLVKVVDGRLLAVRGVREAPKGGVELGLSHSCEAPADDDAGSSVRVAKDS